MHKPNQQYQATYGGFKECNYIINAINTLLLIFTVLFHNKYALVCLQQHKLVNNDSYICKLK